MKASSLTEERIVNLALPERWKDDKEIHSELWEFSVVVTLDLDGKRNRPTCSCSSKAGQDLALALASGAEQGLCPIATEGSGSKVASMGWTGEEVCYSHRSDCCNYEGLARFSDLGFCFVPGWHSDFDDRDYFAHSAVAVGVVAEKLICARTMVQCNRIHFIIATTGIVVFVTAFTLVVVPFLGSPIIL